MYKDFYSVSEFAKLIGKSRRTIYRAIKSNRIYPVRIGKSKNASYRIPYSEIARLAEFDLQNLIDHMAKIQLKEREEK